jgi:hypothetical protein
MEEFVLTPAYIERSIEPSILSPEMARVLQGVDVTYLGGRVRRDLGFARTQIASSSVAVTSCGIFERYDGNTMVVDGNTSGTVRLFVPEGAAGCPRSLVEWSDADIFSTAATFGENFDEETDDVTDPDSGGY